MYKDAFYLSHVKNQTFLRSFLLHGSVRCQMFMPHSQGAEGEYARPLIILIRELPGTFLRIRQFPFFYVLLFILYPNIHF